MWVLERNSVVVSCRRGSTEIQFQLRKIIGIETSGKVLAMAVGKSQQTRAQHNTGTIQKRIEAVVKAERRAQTPKRASRTSRT